MEKYIYLKELWLTKKPLVHDSGANDCVNLYSEAKILQHKHIRSMSTWPKIAKCAWVISIRFLISKFKKNNRRNCHWPVGMPYTPDVATIYPNIDTVLSNYVISDAIYDAGVINNKLSNHIAAYLALSIIINAASCLLLLLASFAADDYAGGAAACFAAAPSPGLAPLFTCNEKQRTRENQRKPYCPCYYYLLDWRLLEAAL